MRALGVIAVLMVAVGCGKVDRFTDGGDDDASIDAKATIDAIPFVCEDQACGGADDCCPSACNGNNDPDCAAVCDNGILEEGELCDPLALCDSSCPAIGCQLRNLQGSGCTAHCENGAQQSACQNGDDCCPGGCNATNDAECAAVCNNGVIESGEHCDPLASCPTSCPQQGCALYDLFGSGCAAQCVQTGTQGSCINGDGCCPGGCNANNDNDCSPVCGNSVVEAGEQCDGNCNICGTETYTCYAQIDNGACQYPTCHQPVTSCGISGDNCCAFANTGSPQSQCSNANDGECAGNFWSFRAMATAYYNSATSCGTVTMYPSIDNYGSFDFTLCQPPGYNPGTGDPVITDVYDDLGNHYNVSNDDCGDPTALPRYAGWNCNNSAGAIRMSCASPSPGGFKPIGAPSRIMATVCPYGGLSNSGAYGTAVMWVWYNARIVPNPG